MSRSTVNDVSCVTRIKHVFHILWQAQNLVRSIVSFRGKFSTWQVNCHFSWQVRYLVKVTRTLAGAVFGEIWKNSRSAKWCFVRNTKCWSCALEMMFGLSSANDQACVSLFVASGELGEIWKDSRSPKCCTFSYTWSSAHFVVRIKLCHEFSQMVSDWALTYIFIGYAWLITHLLSFYKLHGAYLLDSPINKAILSSDSTITKRFCELTRLKLSDSVT